MSKRSRSVLLIVLSGLVFAPALGLTFSLLQPTRHWLSTPVEISIIGPGHVSITANDADGGISATVQALNNNHPLLAGAGWNVTSVGIKTNATSRNTVWKLGDGEPTIAFDEKIKGTCTGSCLAATFTGYYHCNDPLHPDGHCIIDDADIETRKNRVDRYGGPYHSLYEPCTRGKEWNIEAIMVHEVGHVLGIGHSEVSGATMYPTVSSCNSGPATLASDDVSALDALY